MCRPGKLAMAAFAAMIGVHAAACSSPPPAPTITRQQTADQIEADFQAVLAGMPGARIENYSTDHIYLSIDCTGEIEADKAVRLTRYDHLYPPIGQAGEPTGVIEKVSELWIADGWAVTREEPLRAVARGGGYELGVRHTELGGYTLTASGPCVVDDGIRT